MATATFIGALVTIPTSYWAWSVNGAAVDATPTTPDVVTPSGTKTSAKSKSQVAETAKEQ